jgi:septum formation protein
MLVLVSKSPRREEILTRAGIEFKLRPAEVDESLKEGEEPKDHVRRLARQKAEAVFAGPGEILLAADTVVVAEGCVLGKPVDALQAAWMLRQLSGRSHEVLTGICLRTLDRIVVDAESTKVRFVALSEAEISEYAAGGEPMDKAGAYAIQGLASKFIDRIEGCYFNVMGLPVALVYQHLKQMLASAAPVTGKL